MQNTGRCWCTARVWCYKHFGTQWKPQCLWISHRYIVYMDSSSCGIIGQHCKLFQCVHKKKAVHNALHTIYKSCLLTAWCNAKCKATLFWKQYSACDIYVPFDWQAIVSRYNCPMAQTSACPSLSPTDDRLLWSGKMRFSNPCKYRLMGF